MKKNRHLRCAFNYRGVNENSKDFLYPLSTIVEIFDYFVNAEWFTILNFARNYWQIAMHPDSMRYTTFIIPFGQYEFKVMSFRLKQVSRWFQLLMNDILHPIIGKMAVVYLDNIIIFTKGSF